MAAELTVLMSTWGAVLVVLAVRLLPWRDRLP
jgi:hypothetical protein